MNRLFPSYFHTYSCWHAAGLMVTFGSKSETATEMRKYSRQLYSSLESETGLSAEVQRLCPLCKVDDVLAGFSVPEGG